MANQFPLPTPPAGFTPPAPSAAAPLPPQEAAPLPPPEEAPPPPPDYQPPPTIAPATVARSPFRFILPVVIGLTVVGLIGFLAFRLLGGGQPKPVTTTPAKAVTINYWGLWETAAIMKPVIAAFETANPGIKVNYQLQSFQDYQERLTTAMTGPSSPDVARLHSTWLPLFIGNLLPAPANTVSATELQTNFYPIAASTVTVSNQVYGVPVNTDGLVLFTNTNMFKQKNLQPPVTWEDLAAAAKALTERDPVTGKITRAGVALGTTGNVTHWMDIVSLMMLQAGVNLTAPTAKAVNETLTFYTDFAGPDKYWDATLPDSIQAFANEKVAMIIAPLWRIPDLQAINGNLAWQTAALPQLPATQPVNWASFWIEIVPKNAPHPQEAWKFVSFLSSAKTQQTLFESALKERGSAQVPTNKAAASAVATNPLAAPLIAGLTTAKTFYTAGFTRDSSTALNSRLIKYLEDAVNATIKKEEANKITETLNLGFNQVLSQYRLVNPLATPTPQ